MRVFVEAAAPRLRCATHEVMVTGVPWARVGSRFTLSFPLPDDRRRRHGRLVWAAPGHNTETLRGFFDALDDARSAAIVLVSADAADWIAAAVVGERCAHATLCLDPFHVVAWVSEALDEVRPAGPGRSPSPKI